ncbi:MAG: LptF/LptG family permease [Verrucomicrobiota bacterium]
MKTIYLYLIKELLLVAVGTVGTLTFLLVLANVFKDVFDLLLLDVNIWLICQMVLLLIPFTLVFTLPWGVLMAVLIVFGRFSGDQELLALKASGIGLLPIIAPAILMGALFSGVAFVNNGWVAPQARTQFKNLFHEIATSNPMALFTEKTPIDRFPNMRLWFAEKEGNRVVDVHIWQLDNDGTPRRVLRADHGRIEPRFDEQRIVLHLYNAKQEERDTANPAAANLTRPGAMAEELPLEISLRGFFNRDENVRPSQMTLGELQSFISNPLTILRDNNPTVSLTELQKRISLSVACFTFVLVGIPLAIQTQRRETSVGVALSLLIVIGYYFLTSTAEALKKEAAFYPEVIIWLPNILFQTLGVAMIAYVNFRK